MEGAKRTEQCLTLMCIDSPPSRYGEETVSIAMVLATWFFINDVLWLPLIEGSTN
jgi:hypothetical protein